MIQQGEHVFVDTGAWIALALTRDPLHQAAVAVWTELANGHARLSTSVPVVIETFTFLDRNASRPVATSWRDATYAVPKLRVLECPGRVLQLAWDWLERRKLVRLSVVDATSFVLMKKGGIRSAFAFDHHFAVAGFRVLG